MAGCDILAATRWALTDWAMDSSGIRHAHNLGLLVELRPPDRLVLSPLTWRPTPDALLGSAITPELRFPAHDEPINEDLRLGELRRKARLHPMVELCETLEVLHERGAILVAETESCEASRVVEVEQAWIAAGLVGRLMDESISAILTAERQKLPLVCADISVRRLGLHCGLVTMSVPEFAATLAA